MRNVNSTPAFPRAGNEWSDGSWVAAEHQEGMTLRDYFANSYMQGVSSVGDDIPNYEFVALCAYQMADAMLKVRAK